MSDYQTRWERSKPHTSSYTPGLHVDWDLRARDVVGRPITTVAHLKREIR